MKTIGIIGGVASGKSTIAKRLAELGAVVLDADVVGHDVLRDDEVKRALRERFGEGVFAADGQIDRGAVAKIVFAEDAAGSAALADLEAIVHPEIGECLSARIAALRDDNTPAVVLDAAILLKSGWAPMCDTIIFVDVPREQRLTRAATRGWTPAQLDARDARQTPIAQKRAAADVVIDNSGELSHTLAQVDRFWAEKFGDT